MSTSIVLISIHPEYAQKILAGEKKLEFRRRWTRQPVKTLILYATAPIQRIVGIATVGGVTQGTPNELWHLTKQHDGGISRPKLLDYFKNTKTGVAIQLGKITPVPGGIDPRTCLGRDFRPPQSFRYLNQKELARITAARRR